ncbi:MAG: hypothetical protein ACK5NK_07795 [Niabella sp.]
MKAIITCTILLIGMSTFAQKTDLVNAPVNPIVLKYKLEHFNLKGDVFQHDSKYFDKDGNLLRNTTRGEKYSYNQGKILNFTTNNDGYIVKLGVFEYTYNKNGLLILSNERNVTLIKYTYDNQGRLTSEEKTINGTPTKSSTFTYKKIGDKLQVTETIKAANKESYQEVKLYKNGMMVYSKSSNDNIALEIKSKIDAKGNSIQDDYVSINTTNNKSVTDTFDYTIVYYSDALKPLTYTVVLKKGYNNKMYQHIYRNGSYFSSSLKHQLVNSNDLIYYDELTQNYYLAKDVYNSEKPEGTVFKTEIVNKGNPTLLYINANNNVMVFNNGENLGAKAVTFSVKEFNNQIFIYYTDKYTRNAYTLHFPYANNKKFIAGELLEPGTDNYYFFYDSKKEGVVFVKNGETVATNTFSKYGETEKGELVAYMNNKPYYKFPDYRVSKMDKVFPAKYFDPKVDRLKESTKPPTTTTTAGSNASKQTNVQNEIAEKPGASFNSSLPLYVKEVSNNVFYFYQNNKRIQDPIYHQPSSMHKNKGVICYYKTDADYYFYVPGSEDPKADGKYPMYRLRGRHVYTTISKDEQKFVFEGKTLKPQEYDFIVSRAKKEYGGLLVLKDKGMMFHIQSYCFPQKDEIATNSASNSDALGSNSNIFIVFKENGEMVIVEAGKIQPKADWKIINENDRNFLINNVDGRKYRVGIYKLTTIGVIEPNFINFVQ